MLRLLLVVCAFGASVAVAEVSPALREEIPHGTPAELEAFLAGVAERSTPFEQRLLRNGLAWMGEWFAFQAADRPARLQLYEWLPGKSALETVLFGYIRHRDRVQRSIEDFSERRFKALAEVAGAKTADERARLQRDAEHYKSTLDALINEREQNSEDMRAFRESTGELSRQTPDGV